MYPYHNRLTFLHKMKNKNRRLLNWNLLLLDYNLHIKQHKYKDKVCADALSRCCYMCYMVNSHFQSISFNAVN